MLCLLLLFLKMEEPLSQGVQMTSRSRECNWSTASKKTGTSVLPHELNSAANLHVQGHGFFPRAPGGNYRPADTMILAILA